MKRLIAVMVFAWITLSGATGAVTHLALDTRTGMRYARTEEPITFSTTWSEGVTRLVLNVDGVNVLTAITATNGVYVWKPDLSITKTVTLKHTTRGTINEAVTATFTTAAYNVMFVPGVHGSLSEGVSVTQRVPYGEAAVAPTVVPMTGYRFTGWSADISNVTSNFTATAQYEAIPYMIVYEDLHGATHMNPTTYTVEDAVTFKVPESIPRRKFVRWEPASIAVGSMGTVTVRAVWAKSPYVYVNATRGNDAYDGSTSSLAVKTLARAYSLAEAGDVILVAAGTYGPVKATGKAAIFRATGSATINGAGMDRCVTADNDVVFENFVIKNGYDENAGGGVYGGTFDRCVIRECHSDWDGGGAYGAILWNCLVVGNAAENGWGGGAYGGTLVNCTVVDNFSGDEGGGVYAPEMLANTIVSGNAFDDVASTELTEGGANWIGADVGFINAADGDYRLEVNSPCWNAGVDALVKGTLDLVGAVRIANGRVDIGAYEHFADANEIVTEGASFVYTLPNSTNSLQVSHDWFVSSGLAEYGDMTSVLETKFATTYANGYTGWEAYVAGLDPTNALSILQTVITISNNLVQVSWMPNLNTGTVTRIYTVYGRTNLAEGDWETPAQPWHRFFKVAVAMPTGASGEESAVVGDFFEPEKDPGGIQLWANGPYWAECNVGATKPEECGYYFWWGDTVGYKPEDDSGPLTGECYSCSNVTWVSSTGTRMASSPFVRGTSPTSKSCDLLSDGYIDSTGNLVAAYDAATVHLGAPWRMPTIAEIDALINNCDATWTTRNGVYGQLVTGKGAYASKSIFLPAAGYGNGSDLYGLDLYGNFWSSSTQSLYSSWFLGCSWGCFYRYYDSSRSDGQSVRPLRGIIK